MASEAKKKRLSEPEELTSLKSFKVVEVLDEYADEKKITLKGQMSDDDSNIAVLILEKMPFNPAKVGDILEKSSLKTEFRNDIYHKFECSTEPSLNTIKTNLIYPATAKHLAKYTSSPIHIINEDPGLYEVSYDLH